MLTRELRVLLGKEWRQLLRSRGALLTALLFPVVFLLIIPGLQIVGFAVGAAELNNIPEGMPMPPGLASAQQEPKALLRGLLLPLFMTLGGLVVPSVTATYTMIAERENRTLELLVALPVRVGQILLAKLLVISSLAVGITLTIFVVDAALILALGIGTWGYVVALLLVLLSALVYSTASALLISLLAKDFRTANNLAGALIVPIVLSTVALLSLIPGTTALLALAGLFSLGAAAAIIVALRVVTFERLLR